MPNKGNKNTSKEQFKEMQGQGQESGQNTGSSSGSGSMGGHTGMNSPGQSGSGQAQGTATKRQQDVTQFGGDETDQGGRSDSKESQEEWSPASEQTGKSQI